MLLSLSGWNLSLPTDGLLLRQRNASPLVRLLPDGRHLLVVRGEEDLLGHRDHGRVQDQWILLLLLDGGGTGFYDGKFKFDFPWPVCIRGNFI